MKRHCITLCRGDSMPEEASYLDLINAYNGIGSSAPESDNKILGKGYTIFIETNNPPTQEELDREFHSLSILEISEMPAK